MAEVGHEQIVHVESYHEFLMKRLKMLRIEDYYYYFRSLNLDQFSFTWRFIIDLYSLGSNVMNIPTRYADGHVI